MEEWNAAPYEEDQATYQQTRCIQWRTSHKETRQKYIILDALAFNMGHCQAERY